MNEQEQYECIAVPAHMWTDQDEICASKPEGWTRRNWVYRAAASLGVEAMPSPEINTI